MTQYLITACGHSGKNWRCLHTDSVYTLNWGGWVDASVFALTVRRRRHRVLRHRVCRRRVCRRRVRRRHRVRRVCAAAVCAAAAAVYAAAVCAAADVRHRRRVLFLPLKPWSDRT